eukprot:IDg4977t1
MNATLLRNFRDHLSCKLAFTSRTTVGGCPSYRRLRRAVFKMFRLLVEQQLGGAELSLSASTGLLAQVFRSLPLVSKAVGDSYARHFSSIDALLTILAHRQVLDCTA